LNDYFIISRGHESRTVLCLELSHPLEDWILDRKAYFNFFVGSII